MNHSVGSASVSPTLWAAMGTGTAHPAVHLWGPWPPHADSGLAERSLPFHREHEDDEHTTGRLSLGAAHFTQKKSDKLAFPSFPFFP